MLTEQHAALTTYERCLIQLAVYRQVYEAGCGSRPSRPRWHRYPTFESALPVEFLVEGPLSVQYDEATTVAAIGNSRIAKPALVCCFCPRIKAFDGVSAFWSHLQRHEEVEGAQRLEEARRAARLWRAYGAKAKNTAPSQSTTSRRVAQVLDGNTTWSDVRAWDIY